MNERASERGRECASEIMLHVAYSYSPSPDNMIDKPWHRLAEVTWLLIESGFNFVGAEPAEFAKRHLTSGWNAGAMAAVASIHCWKTFSAANPG